MKALRNTTEKEAALVLLPKVTAMLDKLAKVNICLLYTSPLDLVQRLDDAVAPRGVFVVYLLEIAAGRAERGLGRHLGQIRGT